MKKELIKGFVAVAVAVITGYFSYQAGLTTSSSQQQSQIVNNTIFPNSEFDAKYKELQNENSQLTEKIKILEDQAKDRKDQTESSLPIIINNDVSSAEDIDSLSWLDYCGTMKYGVIYDGASQESFKMSNDVYREGLVINAKRESSVIFYPKGDFTKLVVTIGQSDDNYVFTNVILTVNLDGKFSQEFEIPYNTAAEEYTIELSNAKSLEFILSDVAANYNYVCFVNGRFVK